MATKQPHSTDAVAIGNGGYKHESNKRYAHPFPGDLNPGGARPTGDWVANVPAEGQSAPYGAAAYFAWTQTNSFLRFFNLVYSRVDLMGEPKHGLWNYEVPGATLEFYWCDMGLTLADATPEAKTIGLGDHLPEQSGMQQFWDGVRQGFHPPERAMEQIGPLGKAAKLDSIAVDIVRVHLSSGASLWKNVGSSEVPRYEVASHADDTTEYYLMTSHYPGYPDYFQEVNGRRALYQNLADAAAGGDGLLTLNSFVVAVPSAGVLAGNPAGVNSFGVAYDNDTKCPERCGSAQCSCDALLVDLRLEADLGPAWTDPEFGLPLAEGEADSTSTVELPAATSGTTSSKFQYFCLCSLHTATPHTHTHSYSPRTHGCTRSKQTRDV